MKKPVSLLSIGRLFTLFILLFLLGYTSVSAITLPAGFTESLLTQISNPTGMAQAPDGRIFILQQNGTCRIYKNNALLTTPFVSLTVNSSGERGLLGITFDPDFTNNKYVYLYYTATSPTIHNRLSRFTADGDVAVANSEKILLDLNDLTSATNHNGGALNFGKDGKLYIAVGENANGANAQSLSNLLGKILRINSDGSIPTDNPFYNTTTGVNRLIYCYGLRNPFSFDIQPGSGKILVNDVGQGTWEEINEITAGANYGWPSAEGLSTNTNYTNPIFTYNHTTGTPTGCSIIGAAFYNSSTVQFPENYVGKYFFGDFCSGFIKVLDPSVKTISDFATGISNLVDLMVTKDGTLYYLDRGNGGSLHKIIYASNCTSLTITNQAGSSVISSGSNITFTVSVSGSQPITYQWQQNGNDINGANESSFTLTNVQTNSNGLVYRCIISNCAGGVTSKEATLTVTANKPPIAVISSPVMNSLYKAGDLISFSGSGSDPEDGNLPASAFTWWIDFHHSHHVHPGLLPATGSKSGNYLIPTEGEVSDTVWYRIYLKVTDNIGLSDTTYTEIFPRKIILHLETEPAGIDLNVDGSATATPKELNSVIGMERNLEAPAIFTVNNNEYKFKNWNTGSATRQLSFNTPDVNTIFKAFYEPSVLAIDPDVNDGIFVVYPVPVEGFMKIKIISKFQEKVKLVVRSIHGQSVAQKDFNLQAGNNFLELDGRSFSSGIYIISVDGKRTALSKKFMKD